MIIGSISHMRSLSGGLQEADHTKGGNPVQHLLDGRQKLLSSHSLPRHGRLLYYLCHNLHLYLHISSKEREEVSAPVWRRCKDLLEGINLLISSYLSLSCSLMDIRRTTPYRSTSKVDVPSLVVSPNMESTESDSNEPKSNGNHNDDDEHFVERM